MLGCLHRPWGKTMRLLRTACFAAALAGIAAPASAACVIDKVANIPVVMEGLSPVTGVKVNDVDARLLVDTGAFFSSISRSKLSRLKLTAERLPPNFEVR